MLDDNNKVLFILFIIIYCYHLFLYFIIPNYYHISMVRLDKGTETRVLLTMHAYLRRQQCDIYTNDEAWETLTFNRASIRRFYISFKETLKERAMHNYFSVKLLVQ